MVDHELDVRPLPKPGKHPAIFRAYGALGVGESFVLVNDHDPRHLRDEFEAEHPGGYGWEYLARKRGGYRIRITKLAATPLPRVLADAAALSAAEGDATGAVWRLFYTNNVVEISRARRSCATCDRRCPARPGGSAGGCGRRRRAATGTTPARTTRAPGG